MNDQGLSITGKWPIIITEMVMLAGMMGMLWFGLRGPGTAMANISNSFVECPQGMSQECDEIPRDFRPVASPTPLGAGQTFGGQAAVGHGLLSIPASEGSRGADVLLSPNPPMGGVNAGQIGMREPAREKAWAPLDRCDPARVFSSRTGPGERSMEAGNRVIVRSDAAGCTRGRGGREFGGVGAVADSAVRRGVEWLAAGPGRC